MLKKLRPITEMMGKNIIKIHQCKWMPDGHIKRKSDTYSELLLLHCILIITDIRFS